MFTEMHISHRRLDFSIIFPELSNSSLNPATRTCSLLVLFCKQNCITMKIVTAQSLVSEHFGDGERLSKRRIFLAVQELQEQGWVMNQHPSTNKPDYPIVAAREPDPAVRLMRLTYEVSKQKDKRNGVVQIPRGLVRLGIGQPLIDPTSATYLARRGLMLMSFSEHIVELKGETPELSQVVNESRYGVRQRGQLSTLLVQHALGLQIRPKRLTEQRIESAIKIYDGFDIDASDLMTEKWTQLKSRWRIEANDES